MLGSPSRRTTTPSTARHLPRIVVAVGLLAGGVVASQSTSQARGVERVTICHRTASTTNPYVIETVGAPSLVKGHGHHSGDIIPPFTVDNGSNAGHYRGQNLGLIDVFGVSGHAILASGCSVPEPPTVPQSPTTVTTPDTAPASTASPITSAPSSSPATTDGQVSTTSPTPSPTATGPASTVAPTTGAPTPTPTPAPTNAPPTPTQAPPTPTQAPPTNAPTPQPTAAPSPQPTAVPTPAPTAVPPLVPATSIGGGTPPSLPADTQLTPIADCAFVRLDGVVVVWFDYELTGVMPVRVEWGPDNGLSPNGSPPRLFGPGEHYRAASVETVDGVASWTLNGTTATSGPDTPECGSGGSTTTPTTDTTGTTEPGASETTEPDTTDTTEPDTTDTTEPDTTETTEPDTTDTTEPDTTDTTEPDTTEPTGTTPEGCATGEKLIDDECVPVDTVVLSLVDNVIDCDGFATATFAAVNSNPFELDGEDFVSTLNPPHLDGSQPELIGVEQVETENGFEVSETFEVRYVTAVTWSLTHHGITSDISAGVAGARVDDDCPLAAIDQLGVPGTLAPGQAPLLAATGSESTLPTTLAALGALLLGAGLVVATRRSDGRRPDAA